MDEHPVYNFQGILDAQTGCLPCHIDDGMPLRRAMKYQVEVTADVNTSLPPLPEKLHDFRIFLILVWRTLGLPDPTPIQLDIARPLPPAL